MNYGRYQVTKEAGKGSMGIVYEARDPEIGRVVAIKVLRQGLASNEGVAKRFLREAKAIGRLSHPHIVSIYDTGEERGDVYIAMEFVEGRPLSEVSGEGRLPLEQALDLGVQVAEALHYAHERGVVHRDIKPDNIIVQPDGQIKLADFGIARIKDSTATLQTQMGEMMGTPSYMSPEQVLGKPVDGRADLFSFGVVLYELCTGKRPFGREGATLATVFSAIVHETPPSASSAGGVPNSLSAVIMKCLKKSPDARFQTGLELATALRGELSKHEKRAARVAGSPMSGAASRPSFALSRPVVVCTVAVLGAAAVGVGLYRHFLPEKPATAAVTAKPAATSPKAESPPPARELAAATSPAVSAPRPEPRPAREEHRPKAQEPTAGAKAPGRPKPLERPAQPASPTRRPPEKNELTATATSLKVISAPEGASIFIDGRTLGRAPATFMVPVGKHRLRAAHEGYRDVETDIEVRETMEYPLRLFLEPAP